MLNLISSSTNIKWGWNSLLRVFSIKRIIIFPRETSFSTPFTLKVHFEFSNSSRNKHFRVIVMNKLEASLTISIWPLGIQSFWMMSIVILFIVSPCLSAYPYRERHSKLFSSFATIYLISRILYCHQGGIGKGPKISGACQSTYS